jgi:hypothetical protein
VSQPKNTACEAAPALVTLPLTFIPALALADETSALKYAAFSWLAALMIRSGAGKKRPNSMALTVVNYGI